MQHPVSLSYHRWAPPPPAPLRGEAPQRASARRGAAAVLALLMLLALAPGCATTTQLSQAEADEIASPATGRGTMAELSAAVASRHGPDVSGYHMLERNDEALRWRLVLADQALRSIDLQTFIWHADPTADLLLQHLLAAADRGVRVRLLVDEFRLDAEDQDLIALNLHPNFEVRLFNPWHHRGGAVTGVMELLVDFKRMNQRMHNKLMVADKHVSIVGGRNIGEDYFGQGESLNFVDLELLAAGPISAQVSDAFDEYWNSEWAFAVTPKPGHEPPEGDLDRVRALNRASVAEAAERLAAFGVGPDEQRARRAALPEAMSAGPGRVVWDSPMKATPSQDDPVYIIDDIDDLLDNAEEEAIVSVAYFIPQKDGVERVREHIERGVRVQVHTNSLGANDEIVTNSAYKKYRRPLLEAGAELYELRHDAAARPDYETPPGHSEHLVLHTKSIVVDREKVFVGSLNLDPRAVYINSEMGLLVEDPVLAERLLAWFDTLITPDNSWKVGLDERGKLFWESSAGRVDRQPAKSWGEHVGDFFYSLILPESQL